MLRHVVHEPIFALGMLEELGRHGYRISPGTLYPLLDCLATKGYLRSSQVRKGKTLRTVYRATPKGWEALARYEKLFTELAEGK